MTTEQIETKINKDFYTKEQRKEYFNKWYKDNKEKHLNKMKEE